MPFFPFPPLPEGTRRAALAFGALIAASAAQAAQTPQPPALPGGWRMEWGLSETGSYDSNPLMLQQGAQSLWGSSTVLEVLLKNNTPISQFRVNGMVKENLYDQSEFNSTDFHGGAMIGREVERWAASLEGKVDYDTTRSSELTNYGLNLPGVRHTGFSAMPRLSFKPNKVDEWGLEGTALTSNYDHDAYVDYRVYALTPSYSHYFDPRNAGMFMVRAQRYENEDGHVDSIGPSVGWRTLLTPRLTARGFVGFETSSGDRNVGNNDDSDVNYVFSGELTYRGEQDTLDFIASRARQPFGNGTETLLTAFSVTESHKINEKLSANLGGSYKFAEYEDLPGINLKDVAQLDLGLTYRFLEEWDLTAKYRYKTEHLTNISGAIDQSVFLLGISFRPLAAAW